MFRSWFFILVAIMLSASTSAHGQNAPFVNAKAIEDRYDALTPADFEALKQLRVLIASKSIGRNLNGGLALLALEHPETHNIRRHLYDVEKGGGLAAVPSDAFAEPGMVTILATRYPLHRRIEEVEILLRDAPWNFAESVDAVMFVYAGSKPELFVDYEEIVSRMRRDFPGVVVIVATATLNSAEGTKAGSNPTMHAFSELLREHYRSVEPVYDLGAILSDDFRDGIAMVPEYTKDATGVHPNLDAGELAMAKGFLLALHEGLEWNRQRHDSPASATPVDQRTFSPQSGTAPLLTSHPDYQAVRKILDENGLNNLLVEGQIEVEDGRVVGLHLQEIGVTVIPDAIGALTFLRTLHVYADRTLNSPYLQQISPAIANCRELREILINGNDLQSLPKEIVALEQVETLSVAENRLSALPPAVEAWVKARDPAGLSNQRGD